jgi:hypothetical protein
VGKTATHRSIIGAKTDEGFGLVLKHLFEAGLANGNHSDEMNAPTAADITLSFEGRDYYEELRRGRATYRKGFIAMNFGDAILDNLLADVLKPCDRESDHHGFKPKQIMEPVPTVAEFTISN